MVPTSPDRQSLDDQLSHRFIALDPSGYFLIKLDRAAGELVAEHYGNGIDERGLATDPAKRLSDEIESLKND
jgi:hypothetical protein